jgi:uncharacterized membrane protein
MNTATDRRGGFDWRWLALSLSLLCNAFLAALIAGHFLSRRIGPAAMPLAATPMARALERTQAVLSPNDAATFRAVLVRDRSRYLRSALRVAAARRELARQVAAEPFDSRAASQALAAWSASWSGFVNDFSGPLIDALAAISPQGRQRLVAERRAREQRPASALP